MKIIHTPDYAELSRRAADLLAAQVLLAPRCVLGLATGSTPVGMYDELAARCAAGRLSFAQVTSVNLDEYVGLTPDHPQSYRYFMDTHLFSRVDIRREATHVPDGLAADPQQAGAAYDRMIEELGGIDLQVLGIGNNGHIGFNEPADTYTAQTHIVALQPSTINANARFFSSADEVPTHAITMGMRAIMQARRILLLAGAEKRQIVERAFTGPVTPQVPASLLQLHPDVTVIVADA